MCKNPIIDFEELGRARYYERLKSYTAPSFEDPISKSTGEYVLDCCNIDYCKVYRKDIMNHSCLMGSSGERCTLEQKKAIREEAISKGFSFPHRPK